MNEFIIFEPMFGNSRDIESTLTKRRFLRYLGRSARMLEKRLVRPGRQAVMPAGSFRVVGSTGPLVDGKLERTRAWDKQLSSEIGASATSQHIAS
jgi:hypothetical protein